MASITKVEIWEDIAGNIIGLVFEPTEGPLGQLMNAVQNLGAQQPLPRSRAGGSSAAGFSVRPHV